MFGHTVEIKLDGGNNQRFYPGAALSGTVFYKAPAGEKLTSMTIDLHAVTKVDPGKRSKHPTEFIELCHIHERLVRHTITITDRKEHPWHFSFVLPLLTGPDLSASYPPDPLFVSTPHPLPPRMDSSESSIVRIEYQLYAIANETFQARESGGGIGVNQCLGNTGALYTRPVVHNIDSLNFTPDVESLPPCPTQSLSQTISLSRPTKRRFSLRSASASAPSMDGQSDVAIVAELPTVVVAGQPITGSFQLRNTAGLGADFAHKSTALHLRVLTHRRTKGVPRSPAHTESHTLKLSDAAGRGVLAPGTSLPIICASTRTKKCVSSFKSYGVARSYELVLEVGVECGRGNGAFRTEIVAPVELVHVIGEGEALGRRMSRAPPPPPPGVEHGVGLEEELPEYEIEGVGWRDE